MGIFQERKDAMKFFRTYDNVASKGKWKEFVDEMAFDSMVPERPTMAHGGRIGFLKGKRVKDKIFKYPYSNQHGTFYSDKPVDMNRTQNREYKIDKPTKKQLEIAEKVHGKKSNKTGVELWESLEQWERSNIREGHTTGETKGIGKPKKNMLSKTDFTELVKNNRNKTYNEFVEIIKKYKTKDGTNFTKSIVADRLRDYGLSGSFQKEPPKGSSNIKKAEAEKTRRIFLKKTDPTGAKGTTKFPFHHIRQIAGDVPLTTDDIAIIKQRMNSVMSQYNKPLNRIADAISKNHKLALEAMNAKNEGLALDYMKRVNQLNNDAEKLVNSAIKKLPKEYKNLIGFNQFTLPTNEYGLPIQNEPLIVKKIGGAPVTQGAIPLTDLTLEQEKALRAQIKADAKAGKTTTNKTKNNILSQLEELGCPKGGKASGGRVGFSTGTTCAIKGREVAARIIRTGGATPGEKTILRELVGAGASVLRGTGRVLGNLLNPKEFFKLRNLVGPEAMALMAGIEGGIIGYDVINNNTPIKEALGANWITGWAMPRTLDEYQIEEMREKGGFSNESSERFAQSQEMVNELNRAYQEIEFLKIDPTKSAERIRKQKAYDAKEQEYFSFMAEGKGMDPNEFEKDRSRMLEERAAGSSLPEVEQGRYRTLRKNPFANEYGYVDVADEKFFKKYSPEGWFEQGTPQEKDVRILDERLPPQLGGDTSLLQMPKFDLDLTKYKPLPGDYTQAEHAELTEQDIEDLTNYYRAIGKLGEDQELADMFYKDTGKSMLDEAKIASKWRQLFRAPGMQGSQDPYAEGGIASLRKKKW